MSSQYLQFTIEFFDQSGNERAQYNKTDILSVSDFASLEGATSAAYGQQVRYVNGGYTTQPPTISLNAEAEYVDSVVALINNVPIPNPTTESGTLNGQSITQPVSFYIVFPDGTEITDVILSPADFIKLQNTVNVFSVENAEFTTQAPNYTYDQIYQVIQAKSSTSVSQQTPPTNVAPSSLPLLTEFVIYGANGANWDCQLIYSQNPANGSSAGQTKDFTLSTSNVDYWIKNAATVVDHTGIFVPSTTPPIAGSTTAQNTNAPSTVTTSSASTSISQAQTQASQQQQTVDQLNQQLASSQQQQNTLTSQIADLQNQVNKLIANNQQDTAEFSQLQQQLLEATNTLQSLQSQDQQTKTSLSTAQTALTEANNTIALLTAQLNKLNQVDGQVPLKYKAIAVGGLALTALGIWFVDPKKKTVGQIITEKIKDTGNEAKKAVGMGSSKKDDGKAYCKHCHRSHNKDHKHIRLGFENLKNKIKKEYEKKGKSEKKSEEIAEKTAGKIKAIVAQE